MTSRGVWRRVSGQPGGVKVTSFERTGAEISVICGYLQSDGRVLNRAGEVIDFISKDR